jgi:hypothetical protein
MDLARNRREAEYVDKIRQALRDKKLVIIVGAGISLSATNPSPPRITRTGLIRNGLDYLQDEGFVAVDDEDLNHYRRVLQRGNTNIRAILRACGYLKDELDHNRQFATWLESVFGSLHLEVRHPEVFKPLRELHQRGAKLMTTNYDELLERYCGLQRIRRSIAEDVRKYEQGTLDGVFHIHGSFQDPKEVVLDPIGHYQVQTSDDVQSLLKTYLRHNTLLFVGCGSELEDPNLNALLKWASSKEENIPNHHYLLARDGDALKYNPVITVKYGRNYEDLVPYLNALLNDLAHTSTGVGGSIASENVLILLPYAIQATFNSYGKQHEPLCLPYTRVDVLEKITAWANEKDERNIFWLNGLAGTGKSTIARTIARKFYDQDRLGASFFFSRGNGDIGHAGKFFTSIAVQLATRLPQLKRYICDAIVEHRDIAVQSLRDQWRQLVLKPLSKLDTDFRDPLFLVIDALDECDNDRDVRAIVQLFAEATEIKTVRLRIFMTSRPEVPVRYGFYQIPDNERQDFVLHNLDPLIVDRDIDTFLKHELRAIKDECALSIDWPGEQVIQAMIHKSSGLFIWAATACRFISEGKKLATERLSMILKEKSSGTAPERKLDEIYITTLTNSIGPEYDEQEKEYLYELLRRVLGIIVVLFSPLSTLSIAKLLNIPREGVNQTLEDLHAILNIPKHQSHPIRLHHSSFRDFLLDENRCGDAHFWVDEKRAHKDLADYCIMLMSTILRQNICDLPNPGSLTTDVERSRVEQTLSPEVRYACIHWVQHLQKGDVQLHDNSQVHEFLQRHLLHWLESMSLMRETSNGILALRSLESHIPVSHN